MVHLCGRGRAAGEIVGLRLENVRRAIVPRHPGLLDHAAVYGVNGVDGGTPRGDGGSAAPTPTPTERKRAALLALDALVDRPIVVAGPL